MAEVDDVEQAEDDREAEAQQRVEGAVDQPEQQLPEQGRHGNAEDRVQLRPPALANACRACGAEERLAATAFARSARSSLAAVYFTSGQPPSSSGRKASAAGMVATSL